MYGKIYDKGWVLPERSRSFKDGQEVLSLVYIVEGLSDPLLESRRGVVVCFYFTTKSSRIPGMMEWNMSIRMEWSDSCFTPSFLEDRILET